MKIENVSARRQQGSLKACWQRETSKEHVEKCRNGIGSGAKQRQNQFQDEKVTRKEFKEPHTAAAHHTNPKDR
jgi:hypothetical protein